MEIGEQIKEHVARAGLGQRPQAEFQRWQNLLTATVPSQNYLEGIEIITLPPHHEVLSMEQLRERIEKAMRETFGGFHPKPCIKECHRGVVSEVLGNQVEITYETPAGPLKQIYNKEQFVGGVIPNEGDDIEAKVTVTVVDRETSGVGEDFESDIPSFEGRAIKGQARI